MLKYTIFQNTSLMETFLGCLGIPIEFTTFVLEAPAVVYLTMTFSFSHHVFPLKLHLIVWFGLQGTVSRSPKKFQVPHFQFELTNGFAEAVLHTAHSRNECSVLEFSGTDQS